MYIYDMVCTSRRSRCFAAIVKVVFNISFLTEEHILLVFETLCFVEEREIKQHYYSTPLEVPQYASAQGACLLDSAVATDTEAPSVRPSMDHTDAVHISREYSARIRPAETQS